jgi:hypothetical protein
MTLHASIRHPRIVLVLCLTLIPLLLVPSTIHPGKAQTQNLDLLYVYPAKQASAITPTITYQIKVLNMSAFSSWDIYVQTNATVLNPTSIDTTTNTLTANFSITVLPLTSCVNGVGNGCDPAKGDGPGVVHSSILPLGSPPPDSVITGVLFTITYNVMNSAGVSGVLILNDHLSNDSGEVPHTTHQGIYGNAQLPRVDFYWTPPNPGLRQFVNFFSNASDPNPGGRIVGYAWDFGDNTNIHTDKGANATNVYTPSSGNTFTSAACGAALKFNVQLTVKDNLGIQNSQTHPLLVIKQPNIDLALTDLHFSSDYVLPGTVVTITVPVHNSGTEDEKAFNVSLYAENQLIGKIAYDSSVSGGPLACTQRKSFQLSWNTAGLSPGIYKVTALLSPLRNATSPQHEIIESNLQNNMFVNYIRIIDPTAVSLIPLTMPESLGVIVILIVGTLVARGMISRERARRRLMADELG